MKGFVYKLMVDRCTHSLQSSQAKKRIKKGKRLTYSWYLTEANTQILAISGLFILNKLTGKYYNIKVCVIVGNRVFYGNNLNFCL